MLRVQTSCRARVAVAAAAVLAPMMLSVLGGCAGDVGHQRGSGERWAASERVLTHARAPSWQQRADYRISAVLDVAGESVSAECVIGYTNNSPDELRELWLNLEQNLFTPGSLGAMRTPVGVRYGHRGTFPGGYVIEGAECLRQGGTVAEAVEVEVRDTVGRVRLPSAVAGNGGRVELRVRYRFNIPEKGSDRFGIKRTPDGAVYQIGQWFPSVCVYDGQGVQGGSVGSGGGWHAEPYLGQGEFFTDFGDYDVSLTVPTGHVVVATGELMNASEVLGAERAGRLARALESDEPVEIVGVEEVGGGGGSVGGESMTTWRFRAWGARGARSFAWAASAAYAWDACGAELEDGTRVLCQSVYTPEVADVWGPHAKGGGSTRMVRQSVQSYSAKWGKTGQPTLTNAYGVSGGMEYPMIMFCDSDLGERDLWDVTTHEVSHQWFPMHVGSNERAHAWIDEGLTTFMNLLATKERYGSTRGSRGEAAGVRAFAEMYPAPLSRAVWTHADDLPSDEYDVLSYEKSAAGFMVLRSAILGEERFDAALRGHIARWGGKNAGAGDLVAAFNDAAGQDLGWFWRSWFGGTGVCDQAIGRVELVDEDTVRVMIEERGQGGGVEMPVVLKAVFADGSMAEVRRDGSAWGGRRSLEVDVLTGGERLIGVMLDPERWLPDVEPRNDWWGIVTP